MNVARLNMCHGSHEWHTSVIDSIRRLNKEKGYCVAIMVDTEGSEVHTGELQKPLKAETGAEFTFTVRDVSKGNESGENEKNRVIGVSYDGFVDDVEPGDAIVVDGGMVSLEVVSKAGPDVLAVVVEPGLVLSRANLTFRRGGSVLRARNSMLPVLSSKDWLDIDFALAQEVDFIAVSFVKSADVINNLKSYLAARGGKSGRAIEVIAKVESFDSVPNLAEIVEASDAVMVARGDLGAQIPMEDVPSVQKEVSHRVASFVPRRPFFLFTFERKGKKQNKKQKKLTSFSFFLSLFLSIHPNKQTKNPKGRHTLQAGRQARHRRLAPAAVDDRVPNADKGRGRRCQRRRPPARGRADAVGRVGRGRLRGQGRRGAAGRGDAFGRMGAAREARRAGAAEADRRARRPRERGALRGGSAARGQPWRSRHLRLHPQGVHGQLPVALQARLSRVRVHGLTGRAQAPQPALGRDALPPRLLGRPRGERDEDLCPPEEEGHGGPRRPRRSGL